MTTHSDDAVLAERLVARFFRYLAVTSQSDARASVVPSTAGQWDMARLLLGELTAMGSWEVAGKQVVLKDRDGNAIARLYKTADSRFDGSTNSGQPVSLSR